MDGLNPLQNLLMTSDGKGNGYSNIGLASSAGLDRLVSQIKVEGDPAKRTAMISQAFRISKASLMLVPLHTQMITWVMNKSVDVPIRPDNHVVMDWVSVKN